MPQILWLSGWAEKVERRWDERYFALEIVQGIAVLAKWLVSHNFRASLCASIETKWYSFRSKRLPPCISTADSNRRGPDFYGTGHSEVVQRR